MGVNLVKVLRTRNNLSTEELHNKKRQDEPSFEVSELILEIVSYLRRRTKDEPQVTNGISSSCFSYEVLTNDLFSYLFTVVEVRVCN